MHRSPASAPSRETVGDAALMMSVIAQPDLRDSDADQGQPPAYHTHLEDADPRKWRIAWSPTLGFVDVQPEVRRIAEKAVAAFADMGAEVEEVEHVMDDPWPVLARFKRGLTAYAFRNLSASRHAEMDPRFG